MRQLTDIVNATEAANTVGIDTAVLRMWRKRGHIEPAAYNELGHPQYRLIDVFRAERDTRSRSRFTRPDARREFPAAA